MRADRASCLRALQASFLIVGLISTLAIFPATRLPGYTAAAERPGRSSERLSDGG